MGLHFFIVSLAWSCDVEDVCDVNNNWSCDETNFKLLLRKKISKNKAKISVRFQGPPKNVFVSLACNVMKQTLSYYALNVSYISKRFCWYNIFHLFEIVGNLTKTRLKSSLEKYLFEIKYIFKSNSKFVSSHFQANKTFRPMAKRFLVNGHWPKWARTPPH